MRLVCPNCEAKYEVPEDAIPETGRDVQCANCGHAWFQMRSRAASSEPASVASVASVAPPAPAPAPVAEAPAAPEVTTAPVAEVAEAAGDLETDGVGAVDAPSEVADKSGVDAVATPSVADETAPDDADMPTEEASADAVEVAEAPVAEPAPPAETVLPAMARAAADAEQETGGAPEVAAGAAAYAVDESVLAILREEAEREARARATEAAKPLEVQPDLGIDQAMPVAAKVEEVSGEDPSLAARRARLPDVEEINSTLRPSENMADDVETETMPVAAEGRSSFRSGFLLVLSVAILGSAVYGSADAIADAIPALAGPLKSYVGFVDSLRLQLDGLMQSATVAINGS